MKTLLPQPLIAEAFAPFGDVIECRDDNRIMTINEGLTQRHHDLAIIQALTDSDGNAGQPIISIFSSQYRAFPLTLTFMERHPLGSQCFIPMHDQPFVVVVARPELTTVSSDDLHAFVSNGQQAVNYHANVWHHYLIAPFEQSQFVIVDRGGKGHNLEEQNIADGPVSLLLN